MLYGGLAVGLLMGLSMLLHAIANLMRAMNLIKPADAIDKVAAVDDKIVAEAKSVGINPPAQ